jgi:hypothetical protein
MLDKKQLYWNDIEIGTEVTPISKIATTVMLVKWAGASADLNPLHYDNAFAVSQKMEGPIVQGQLKRAWLVQMVTDWIGEYGDLKFFSCQYRGVDYPRNMKSMEEPDDGEIWWCKGTVTNKYEDADDHYVECDVWVENGKGEKTTVGTAKVVLPTHS